jgi:hypothetical protein
MSKLFQALPMKLLTSMFVGSFLSVIACATFGEELNTVPVSAPPIALTTTAVVPVLTNETAREWIARENPYYKRNWGVEVVGIKPVTSGYMLSFKYRITDPEKAKALNDRQSKAYLIDAATGIHLAVPAMEKVGELRTGAAPKTDRTYFMIFGNPGKLVKSGSRVNVVAGNFHIDNLIVD